MRRVGTGICWVFLCVIFERLSSVAGEIFTKTGVRKLACLLGCKLGFCMLKILFFFIIIKIVDNSRKKLFHFSKAGLALQCLV